MHGVDATTEQMIRSVLAYAENRLRLDPVPLDEGSRDPAELDLAGPEPVTSVAAPIRGWQGIPIAALSVVTRTDQVEPAVLRPAVVAVARAISRALPDAKR
jgi:hypothetical protein